MASAHERSRGLPPAVVERAATRLGQVALATAAALPAMQLLRAAARPALVDAVFNPVNRLVLLGAVLASAALFAARHFRLTSPSMLLRLGTAWQVVIAFALALVETTRPAESAGRRAGDFGRGAVDPDRQRTRAQPPAAGADGVARGGDGLADRLRGQRRARHGRRPKRRVAAVAAAQLRASPASPISSPRPPRAPASAPKPATTWAATAWSRASGKVGWARSGRPVTSCWRAPPR